MKNRLNGATLPGRVGVPHARFPVRAACVTGRRSIHEEKIKEILALKRRLGLPDARMSPLPAIARAPANPELEELVRQVIARMEDRA